MGRMTRAKAAEVAERLHVDEDVVLQLPSDGLPQDLSLVDAKSATNATPERAPLGELAPNSAESVKTEEAESAGKTVKGKKGGKRGGKGRKKQDLGTSVGEQETGEAQDESQREESPAGDDGTLEVGEEGDVIAEEPAVEAAVVEESVSQMPTTDEMRQTDPASLTTQLGESIAENELQDVDDMEASKIVEQTSADVQSELPAIDISEQQPQDLDEMDIISPQFDAPASPLASAMPSVIKNLRTDTPGKRSTSNKENVEPIASTPTATPSTAAVQQSPYDSLEDAVVQAATPPIQRGESSTRSEDAIEKLDELDDAVEKINQEIPDMSPSRVRPSSPPKAPIEEPSEEIAPALEPEPVQPASPTTSKPAMPAPAKPKPKTKPAPIVRTTKASAARLSLAQGQPPKPTESRTARPRPSTTMGLNRASSVRQSTTAKPPVSPNAQKKPANIPHSKPRPVSLSFPTPPPPPKSTKAPTTSSFQLPGEAVAARLKAAREAREKREAESSKSSTSKPDTTERKPSFKARPVPASLKTAPTVRATKASGARESTIGLARAGSVKAAPSKPAPASTLQVSKRPRPSTTAPATNASTTTTARITSLSQPKAPRTSTSNNTQRATSNGTSKGKEVFNRAALAKSSAEAEKKAKEEGAKKARAEAAERSRVLSREWAEKRRAKVEAGKSKGVGA